MRNLILLSAISLFAAAECAQAISPAPSGSYANSGYDTASPVPGASYLSTDKAKRVTLTCGSGNTTAANYYRLGRLGTQTTSQENYQVPASKALYCDGFYYQTSATMNMNFGYGTAAVTNNNNTAPAGEKEFNGGSGLTVVLPSSSGALKWLSLPMMFPASTYPFCQFQSATVDLTVIPLCEER